MATRPLTSVHPKVALGALAGAITTIGVWVAEATKDITVPTPVVSALIIVTSFALGYLVPSDDIVVTDEVVDTEAPVGLDPTVYFEPEV